MPEAIANARDRDGTCRVQVTPDNMEAYLEIIPPQGAGKWPARKDADDAVHAEGIIFGIDDAAIDDALNKQAPSTKLIARGKSPVQGVNAEFNFLFETGVFRKASAEDEHGKIDYHNIQTIQNVVLGQVIVEKIPATKGEPGRDVHGKEIPAASGKDKLLKLGKNVAWSQDGLKLAATHQGEPIFVNGKISVLDAHEIDGNVDFNTGNVKFSGNLLIRGNVTNGFKVEAEGDITIYGSVEAADITAGGNLYVQGGISGLDKSVITSTGDFSAKYVEHAVVNCSGNITIREAVMYCQVNSDQKISVESGRGLIVGGLVRAGGEIAAKVIGSRLGTVTEIEVGVIPRLKLEYQELENDIKLNKENIEKSEKAINLLSKIPNLPPDRQDTLQSLIKTVYALKGRVTEAEARRQQLLEEMVVKSKLGKVKVTDTIFPGTRVTIGKSLMIVPDELKFVVFYYSEGEVQLQSYR